MTYVPPHNRSQIILLNRVFPPIGNQSMGISCNSTRFDLYRCDVVAVLFVSLINHVGNVSKRRSARAQSGSAQGKYL